MQAVKTNYKHCVVPMCESTTTTSPQKLFINIPKIEQMRKKWLTLARRDTASMSTTSTRYFCEDHFDISKDMENYVQYTTMGVVSQIRMRPGCLPTKFACQANRASNEEAMKVAALRERCLMPEMCSNKIKTEGFFSPNSSSDFITSVEVVKEERNDYCMNYNVLTDEDDNFACDVCKQQFPQESQLKQHILSAHSFEDTASYQRTNNSIKTESIPQPLLCSNCNQEFYKSNLEYLAYDGGLFLCNVCSETTVKTEQLGNNTVCRTPEKSFVCSNCDKSFTQRYGLKRHIMVTHTSEKPYYCHLCDKRYKTKAQLNDHVLFHSVPHLCHLCGKGYKSQHALSIHVSSHRGEKPYKCHLCDKRYANQRSLSIHVLFHHSERSFACNFCDETFKSKLRLKSHIKCHSDDKPFVCNNCDQSFSKQHDLKRHIMLTHTSEKPFECHLCDKRCKSQRGLSNHVFSHSNSNRKDYKCGKRFKKQHGLSVHALSHSGRKHYKCHLCGRRFEKKLGLSIHVSSHIKEQHGLSVHALSQSGGMHYKCHLCGRRFEKKLGLSIHVSSHIKEKGKAL